MQDGVSAQYARTLPLLSILVVVFKAVKELPELLESILERKGDDAELIVIDGGSRDGTVEYLRDLGAQVDYWRSEPDTGIYDAMNKAVAQARGTFLLHLNVGDTLVEIPRKELENARDEGIDVLSFPVALSGGKRFRPAFGAALRFHNTLHHQGTFYRRTSFPDYDAGLRLFADFDVNQRLALQGARVKLGTRVVAFHGTEGVSGQKTSRGIAEFLSVIRKNHGRGAVLVARLMGKWRGLKARLGWD